MLKNWLNRFAIIALSVVLTPSMLKDDVLTLLFEELLLGYISFIVFQNLSGLPRLSLKYTLVVSFVTRCMNEFFGPSKQTNQILFWKL